MARGRASRDCIRSSYGLSFCQVYSRFSVVLRMGNFRLDELKENTVQPIPARPRTIGPKVWTKSKKHEKHLFSRFCSADKKHGLPCSSFFTIRRRSDCVTVSSVLPVPTSNNEI